MTSHSAVECYNTFTVSLRPQILDKRVSTEAQAHRLVESNLKAELDAGEAVVGPSKSKH